MQVGPNPPTGIEEVNFHSLNKMHGGRGHQNLINSALVRYKDTLYKVWQESIIPIKLYITVALSWLDLENKVKVTQILSTFFPLQTIYLCQLGKI